MSEHGIASSPPIALLSASDYRAAQSCAAKLYYRKHYFADNRDRDPYQDLLADGAYMVKALVRARYPDAVEIPHGLSLDAAVDATRLALAAERVVVANATLRNGRRHARVDLLDRTGDVIRMIDVRSKSFEGDEHAESLAGGGKGVFRAKRKPWALRTEWVPRIDDLAFKVSCLASMVPGVRVVPVLALVDTSKRGGIDDVPSLFAVETTAADAAGSSLTYRFLGDDAALAALDVVTEVECGEEVAIRAGEVEAACAQFETLLDSEIEDILAGGVRRGAQCGHCEYRIDDNRESGFHRCWGSLAEVDPHVLELFSVGSVSMADGSPMVEALFGEGSASLLDVPLERLVTKDGVPGATSIRQLRQIEHTRSGAPYVGPGLKGAVGALTYPLHFIDFEASRLALPYHAGMRPYGLVAFQWSCHTVRAPGLRPEHTEWLNDVDIWPNEGFAEALRRQLGDSGSILTWSYFERGTLEDIASELRSFGRGGAELHAWLGQVHGRVVDLEKWAKTHYYHPGMRGRTSIKVVLDALWRADPRLRSRFEEWTGRAAAPNVDPYAGLPPATIGGVEQVVREGTAAIRAYQALMYGPERSDPAARAAWSRALLDYCALDTLAMVLLFDHWRALVA